jgi:hypothetical protein
MGDITMSSPQNTSTRLYLPSSTPRSTSTTAIIQVRRILLTDVFKTQNLANKSRYQWISHLFPNNKSVMLVEVYLTKEMNLSRLCDKTGTVLLHSDPSIVLRSYLKICRKNIIRSFLRCMKCKESHIISIHGGVMQSLYPFVFVFSTHVQFS